MAKPVILCVDDETVILTSLRDQLIHHLGTEYTVEVAESGEEALELLEELSEEGIDVPVIISDQIMPGMKGDELLIEIHGRYPKALKIFLTGQADANAVGNAVNQANLYRYIAKPWDEADLKLTVTEALYSYSRDKQLAEQNELLEKLYLQAQEEIGERKRVEALLAEANQNLEQKVSERTRELSQAVEELKATQNQLVAQERMATLGMLVEGIAHEIKNPLNLINSFAALSIDLADELRDIIGPRNGCPVSDISEKIAEILSDLQSNAANIYEEGQRADSIVKSMLIHSHRTIGGPQDTDLNALLGEAVNLTYYSMRSRDSSFDIRIETDYDPTLDPLKIIPQDLSRVFVNVINNAYDAMQNKQKTSGKDYVPCLTVTTKNLTDRIEIRIQDNGIGIPAKILPEIFNPFVTTKPEYERTGLGLSISYNIIARGHQGKIEVETEDGQYTEFIISLPK
ncbi:ATP-binding protein [Desulfobacterales bacterium HSG2]|nr:ATP-binding protein [Desulfobacterales bacterium HSG2]